MKKNNILYTKIYTQIIIRSMIFNDFSFLLIFLFWFFVLFIVVLLVLYLFDVIHFNNVKYVKQGQQEKHDKNKNPTTLKKHKTVRWLKSI